MTTKKQKTDEDMEELLKKIPEGETAIITEINGKTYIFITQKHATFSYII